MFHLKLLGTAAGGGVPQWNCACSICSLGRSDPGRVTPRLQAQASFTSTGNSWYLINASPDLRIQIEQNQELHPSFVPGRNTPISGIVLTGADIDQVLGLLLLREFQPITVYATPLVRHILEANPFMRMLRRAPNQLTWIEIAPGETFSLDGITCTPFSMPGSLPHYALDVSSGPDGQINLGLLLSFEGRTIAYTPSVPTISDMLMQTYKFCHTVLVDGTFWSDDELCRAHPGTPLARSIGHIPMSGPDGSIALLEELTGVRRVFVHMNNTNPVLDQQSPEYRYTREHDWEIGFDGWRLD